MLLQDLLATVSGVLVGFVLGLIGGGGSVLAVPLLVYLVGVQSPHVAIGTSAVAVAASALFSLIGHAGSGHVKWPCALVFATAGIAGAALSSTLGKNFDGQKLLLLFGVLMIVIAALMFLNRDKHGDVAVRLTAQSAPHLTPLLLAYGTGVGALAGFFGIGGGFLVVPGIIAATGMPLIFAIGSSLVSVFAFGVTTAANYAVSGLIDWVLVAFFIAGGFVGGIGGHWLAGRLAAQRQMLATAFAVLIALVGMYVVWRGLGA
jgi:uncharacterized membrane protein YfcA